MYVCMYMCIHICVCVCVCINTRIIITTDNKHMIEYYCY